MFVDLGICWSKTSLTPNDYQKCIEFKLKWRFVMIFDLNKINIMLSNISIQ